MKPSSSNTYNPISPIEPENPAVNHAIIVKSSNTKSRVETQIKMTLQLVGNQWSWLRVHESLLSKKKINRQIKENELHLEAFVVADSNPNQKVNMCQGCVRRERKRAQRRKIPVVDDRQRILLFNCDPLIDFSHGEAVLLTRITCYCRHHNERIGFRIQFRMRNDKGVVIATGESSPIMVTDDHKSYTSPPEKKYSVFPTPSHVSCSAGETHQAIIHRPPVIHLPILDSITPCRGSGWGGQKVTIIGFGFHGYLVPMFNKREAIVLGWSSTEMHCILPPAEQSGPVIVSFKHQTLNTTHPLFYYTEQENTSILDLAMKITGIQNHIASQSLEMDVIQLLSGTQACVLNATTDGGQTLLHLASYFNYTHLIKFLIARDLSLVYLQDHNGLSALHFGCLRKSTEAMCTLLKWGAFIALKSVIGTPMDIVSTLLTRDITIDKTESDWIPNLF
ncbi:hypothetical protein INT47_005137, partial [Mucor saturninus]